MVCETSFWDSFSRIGDVRFDKNSDVSNELRVCAARSRRRSSVGRTRGVGRRLALWRFHQGRSERGLITRLGPAGLRGTTASIAVGSGTFKTIGNVIWSKVGSSAVLARGDLAGVPRHAAARPDDGGGSFCCRSWRHGLLRRVRRDRTDEDQPPLMTVWTDPWLDRRHWLCVRVLA